jgi:hypothetical protein
MADATKFVRLHPEKDAKSQTPAAESAPVAHIVPASLVAALGALEKEFRKILQRARQPEPPDTAA